MHNNTAPLVSVIMGVYNCEKTLERAIKSIEEQTYTAWEFIICDDCSTDSSPRILEQYQDKENFTIIRNDKNRRLAYSLNQCLKYANGKYIARMDSDDISLPERFRVQVDFLEAHPRIDLAGTGYIVFDENNKETIHYGRGEADKKAFLFGGPFPHPTVMMKKSVLDALGGYRVAKDTLRAEDLDLWFRFYHAGYRGVNIEEPLYKYQETMDDYKKRTLKAGIETSRVFFRGYNLLKAPWYMYPLCLKPIVSALVPDIIMKKYHQ